MHAELPKNKSTDDEFWKLFLGNFTLQYIGKTETDYIYRIQSPGF
jgi:hypothetical protein